MGFFFRIRTLDRKRELGVAEDRARPLKLLIASLNLQIALIRRGGVEIYPQVVGRESRVERKVGSPDLHLSHSPGLVAIGRIETGVSPVFPSVE